ncbi:MAG TPA: metalloregulator ArsR/SmtB family transcription factor [Methanoregulaceae archaeon]|nr:metalloregulator ArsR/SmtB family transcription factor [Methanoregulaceae archaeon]HPD76410.1 metalloregulator ArsR/SmtB family transcription factor [Methanoregulaceae archaeon]HRY75841.1 metalloregulator ArsR/SmtB family transcription factor [Methanoregulaceae archaeon]
MNPGNTGDEHNTFCNAVPQMAGTFKALGDLTRLQIIYLLSTDTSGTLGVSDLAARLGISQPAVSQHLKTLKNEGLVESRREGFYIYYTVNRERMVEFREHFEQMYTSVMEKCSREMIRKTTRDRPIRACVIFYSYSGITRRVAEGIRNASGCDLVEVRTKKPYTWLNLFPTGVMRARRQACDPIEPGTIDVSGYDLLIIGTPVWTGKPTPAINAAVRALTGCEGKMAVVFITYLNCPGEALEILSRALADRGVRVMAEISLDEKDTKNPDAGSELLRKIIAADPLRDMDDGSTERNLNVT